jgi:hypothetical protein
MPAQRIRSSVLRPRRSISTIATSVKIKLTADGHRLQVPGEPAEAHRDEDVIQVIKDRVDSPALVEYGDVNRKQNRHEIALLKKRLFCASVSTWIASSICCSSISGSGAPIFLNVSSASATRDFISSQRGLWGMLKL